MAEADRPPPSYSEIYDVSNTHYFVFNMKYYRLITRLISYFLLQFLSILPLPSTQGGNNRLTGWTFAHPVNLICPPSKFNLPIAQKCPSSKLPYPQKNGHHNYYTYQNQVFFFVFFSFVLFCFFKIDSPQIGSRKPHSGTPRIGNTLVLS